MQKILLYIALIGPISVLPSLNVHAKTKKLTKQLNILSSIKKKSSYINRALVINSKKRAKNSWNLQQLKKSLKKIDTISSRLYLRMKKNRKKDADAITNDISHLITSSEEAELDMQFIWTSKKILNRFSELSRLVTKLRQYYPQTGKKDFHWWPN